MSHPFDLLMELKPHQIRLDCAALHLARDYYPTLNIGRYLGVLDALAEEVAALRPGLAATLRYRAMREVLVRRRGLTGNREHYYDPRNCYLNFVLDTNRGIPITLSTVWIEIGRRLKWPVAGVALPGHFIVRFDDPEQFVLADPFHDGRSLSIGDCRRIVYERFGDDLPFRRSYLRPVSNRGILARLLRNLRNVYLAANDLPRLACILRRMAAVEPKNGRHLQDLAAVACRQGDVRSACAHLNLYLRRVPRAPDSARVRRSLRVLEAALVALN
jgi:regulator of sirC expression with transglutaminase-like and TPR domain